MTLLNAKKVYNIMVGACMHDRMIFKFTHSHPSIQQSPYLALTGEWKVESFESCCVA